MKNAGDIQGEEWQAFLVGSTVKDDSRFPQPASTKPWLDFKVSLFPVDHRSQSALD
jgi:hypothetical protein